MFSNFKLLHPFITRNIGDRSLLIKGTYFDKNTQVFRSTWYENYIEKKKGFSINKYGVDVARQMAIDHRLKMVESGRASLKTPAEFQSGVKNVIWQSRCWRVYWQKNKQTFYHSFSLSKYGGFNGALNAAKEFNNKRLLNDEINLQTSRQPNALL